MTHPTAIDSPTSAELPEFRLAQNYLNPFNPTTTVTYDVAADMRVRLSIYALNGQIVRALVDKEQPAGTHAVNWDGTADRGGVVASGLYVYRMEADGIAAARKMLLLG